jgi:hypothetical protein
LIGRETLTNKDFKKGEEKSIMKKLVVSGFSILFVLLVTISLSFAEAAPQSVVDLANSKLAAYGTDPVLVDAVKAENAKGKSMADIEAMDAKWKADAGVADYMKAMMDSAAGKRLAELRDSEPYLVELFLMDNQGANVAMSDKTSDYWQGDEAKFKKSFNDGKGAVFVDDVEFDSSAQAYLCQVSVPVKDGDTVIGAITFGIDIEKVK